MPIGDGRARYRATLVDPAAALSKLCGPTGSGAAPGRVIDERRPVGERADHRFVPAALSRA